jgi:hypothetical protein
MKRSETSKRVLLVPEATAEVVLTPADAAVSQAVQELSPPPLPIPQLPVVRRPRKSFRQWLNRPATASFLASLILHVCILLSLGLLFGVPGSSTSGSALKTTIDAPGEKVSGTVLAAIVNGMAPITASRGAEGRSGILENALSTGATGSANSSATGSASAGFRLALPGIVALSKAVSPGGTATARSIGRDVPRGVDLLQASDGDVRDGLSGRRDYRRQQLIQAGGGTQISEDAVAHGLRWLQAHQQENGSWRFDLQGGMCYGRCRNPGTVGSTTASTALGILPFLGAGHTHTDAADEYHDLVQRGLYYLQQRAVYTPHGSDLQEGTMYAQALATIALCEAYGLTGDKQLKNLAQTAIDFIVFAQERQGGGWRYVPGLPGDITVTGWQVMALKSGQMAHLNVPRPTIYLAQHFLDSVERDNGAQYAYLPQDKCTPTPTAIGLLCRVYTGWRRNKPALYQGVKYLMQWGPSADNMYFNYYVTQVLHHWEGPDWDTWNRKMREFLVRTQATQGHESGSWYFSGGKGDVGGRLYNTALAIMTLEVYYRYMPLYTAEANQEF